MDNGSLSDPKYLHSLTRFDMDSESTQVTDVPDYVPILGQSLVFLNVGDEGMLVAFGGMTEINGVISRVGLSVTPSTRC
jgi:hypothetical protein